MVRKGSPAKRGAERDDVAEDRGISDADGAISQAA
jgi:hypothetical protein